MDDENACESFVEHQEFLAMKAQKRASKRNTLPNIDWNNEDYVSSLTAHKLKLYLKQLNLQVSGGKATSVASVLRLLNKYWNPKTMTQLVPLSCNLVTRKIQTQDATDARII